MFEQKIAGTMNDKAMLQRCQDGDMEGYRMVYERYGQLMYSTAFRMLGNRSDAEDAVQTSFIRLTSGLKHFQARSKLSTYIYRIIINVSLDMIKKQKREKYLDIERDNPRVQPTHDLRLALEDAIASLPDMQRACFILFAVEGVKQSEIARIMDLSLGGVKSNIFHAKKRLRKILESPEFEV
jgi:RNA polymerase sigma-70 factor (ECF subfamily)